MSWAKLIFLLNALLAGGLLSFGLAQVPQPWRGVLVAWLLFGASGALVLIRIVRGYLAYRAQRPPSRKRAPRERRPEMSLEIVGTRRGAGGRVIVR